MPEVIIINAHVWCGHSKNCIVIANRNAIDFNSIFRSGQSMALLFEKCIFFAKNMLITPNQNGQKQIGAQTKWRKFTENGQNTIKTEGWSISIRLLCPEFQSSSFFSRI